MRRFRAGAYLLGATLMAYGVINLLYDLNIDFFDAFKMPFGRLYREQLIPLLITPLEWTGLDLRA